MYFFFSLWEDGQILVSDTMLSEFAAHTAKVDN